MTSRIVVATMNGCNGDMPNVNMLDVFCPTTTASMNKYDTHLVSYASNSSGQHCLVGAKGS